ncbi:hypothetical protein PV327_008596 [Microctonus hyperodae]|uniref:C1q domain-containing protein n=1 Tax=Microctonus hyperodae TaxID=165561 RepID=A0AA39F3H5_MICHY|nr:hypothetical protein PV327_008596 [Microctonus hyperodae]
MLVWTILLGLSAGLLVNAARPDPPRSGITTVGSLKLATAEDCVGLVAFSATSSTNNDAQLIFRETLVNKGVGYIAETGIFTTHCPGIYHISFAGYGSDLKLTLKRKANNSNSWKPIVSTGSRYGGANQVILDCDVGDQFAVFVDAGKSNEGTTFSGYRIAKK